MNKLYSTAAVALISAFIVAAPSIACGLSSNEAKAVKSWFGTMQPHARGSYADSIGPNPRLILEQPLLGGPQSEHRNIACVTFGVCADK